MIKKVLAALSISLVCHSHASAITITNAQFDATALAVTNGPVGFDAQASPPSTAPVAASADSVGATDVATAGAIGGPNLLTTSADVSGGGGIANSVGTAHFIGSFLMSVEEPMLILGFSSVDFAVGSGLASTSLFVTLTSGGNTLFEDLLTAPTTFGYPLAGGVSGTLELTLNSEASAGFPTQGIGNASSFGLVTIASAVPEPESALLLLVGLGPIAAIKRRRERKVSTAAI